MPSPGLPSPTSGKPGGEESKRSDRREAGERLKKAGKQIADAAKTASGQEESASASNNQSPADQDPLIPESDIAGDGHTDGAVASDSQANMQLPDFSSEGRGSDEEGSEGDTSREMSDSTSGGANTGQESAAGGGDPWADDLSPEEQAAIVAAQEALEQAGIALQTAGETLGNAATDEELAAAQGDLSKARIGVIIAGQDLLDLREVLEGTVNEDIFAQADDALNEANVAILIATESIFSTEIDLPNLNTSLPTQGDNSDGLPDFPSGPPGGRPGVPDSELEKELNDSIAIFEGKIIDARNVIIEGTPAPTGDANVPGVMVLGGNTDPSGQPTLKENERGEGDVNIPEVLEPGSMPGDGQSDRDIAAADNSVPEDIPDPQGDDIVAKQLREAASSEKDPALRAKLWEEYRKYRAGL
ncbi:MAG: hypothetical protein ACI8Z1_000511 [Candidatus Azotimanducaceae bacterium]|jgi:hypothetical protein